MKKLILILALVLIGSGQARADTRKYVEAMGLEQAWKITRGSESMIVATLNTGVNYHLPEFAGRIARDGQGNYGYDAVTDTPDPMDHFSPGLGTQVASVIAGNTVGVAPGVRLLPVRVFDENGVSGQEIFARGLIYAIENGARIVDVGGIGSNVVAGPLCEAMKRAEAEGILLIGSAGNEGRKLESDPIACPLSNFVAVASANVSGDLSYFSNYGFLVVKVAAFGEGIWGINRGGALASDLKGGSFASAVTSAVAALVWSAHPRYNVRQVIYSLVRGSVLTSGLSGKVLGNGYLHALGAIQADPSAAVK